MNKAQLPFLVASLVLIIAVLLPLPRGDKLVCNGDANPNARMLESGLPFGYFETKAAHHEPCLSLNSLGQATPAHNHFNTASLWFDLLIVGGVLATVNYFLRRMGSAA